jgi:hypothetical protein
LPPLSLHSAGSKVSKDIKPLPEEGEDLSIEEGEAEHEEHRFGGVFYEGFGNHSVDYDARDQPNIKKKDELFFRHQSATILCLRVGGIWKQEARPLSRASVDADRPP